ncbi:nitroreductase family deazaflavin-dependent oxidoreductase [Mycobacterium sp. SMC-8]|uniref:nitroreductase/quinone reductase family protein n=1 Tax=Mycobacterium sp. SMC-8 TaxID=2857060 RepID=UPI0021B1BC05|nr:nitroreductase/quinone reductase family protein [Mycobacterium sp. SMC-8]UXA11258.1 nitroreductase family deazaflavin-dependent oxidoreductase [Mycobacterium sp. SMC-8]
MSRGIFDSPLVGVFNAGAARLIDAPVIGPVVRRAMVVIRYTGRRSGQTFQTPVNYQRSGDAVVIRVNFDGADRTGHAVAAQDEQGRVTVRVRLNP